MKVWITKFERFDYVRRRWVPVNPEELKPTMIESYLEVEKGRAFWRTLVTVDP